MPAGPNSPCQIATSKPGTAEAIGTISGIAGEGRAVVMAMPRNSPERIDSWPEAPVRKAAAAAPGAPAAAADPAADSLAAKMARFGQAAATAKATAGKP
jgi:hypothetical protein